MKIDLLISAIFVLALAAILRKEFFRAENSILNQDITDEEHGCSVS